MPARTRHLATHANHLVALNDLDRDLVTGEVLSALGAASEPAGWQARLKEIESIGVTEVVYQPAGPDIERELSAFARVAGL